MRYDSESDGLGLKHIANPVSHRMVKCVQFEGLANDIIDISDSNIKKILNVLQSLSLLTTSFLITEHEANPNLGKGFVTIPDVEEHFRVARETSGALVIAYLPEVSPSEVEGWNQYSQEKQGWIQESHGSVYVTDAIVPTIWETPSDERIRALADVGSTCGVLGQPKYMSDDARADRIPVEPDLGPFSPVWTFSPPPLADNVEIVNYNLRASLVLQKAVEYIAANKQPTFLDVCNRAAWFDNQEHSETPQAVVALPVYVGYDQETSDVVGHLVAIIPWEVALQDIIPDDTDSLRIVLENTCDELFTVEVKGPDAMFLSADDLHDETYADLAIRSPFANIHDEIDDNHISRRAEESNAQTCPYSITIYPTRAFEEGYFSEEPIIFASVVVGVFFVTTILFVIFDCYLVERTERVMDVALKQNAIVSSLFPQNVQAKMMAEADQNEQLGKLGKAGIKRFLHADKENGETNQEAMTSSKPIAGKYRHQDCTIFQRSKYLCSFFPYPHLVSN